MIKVHHSNTELELLITVGKCVSYGKTVTKRAFLMALRSFYTILEILDDTTELKRYEYLQYKRGVEISSVLISASKIQGKLLFKEYDHGGRIDILDLII